jgi:hypothetical protein
MMTASQSDRSPSPPLGPVLGTLPAHLFQQEVLRRLGPTDLASLAGAGRGCAAAVAATALMQWAKHAKLAPRPVHQVYYPPLCLTEACSYAAHCGNREVLEWLHSTGCTWNDVTCAMAAGGGHLEVLQWARKHGCPWNWLTPTWAAYGGHLEVLQWVRENDVTGEVWHDNIVLRSAGGPRKHEVLT